MKMKSLSSVFAVLMAVLLILSGMSIAFLVSDNAVTTDAEEEKLEKDNPLRPATRADIESLKQDMGVYQPGRNYNKMYGDKGTGLAPPTEEQYNKIATDLKVADNGRLYTMGEPDEVSQILLNDDGESIQSGDGSTYYTLTDEDYMPPIGNQGGQGSCAAFSATYYGLTNLMAQDYNYNVNTYGSEFGSTSYPPTHDDMIMSPAWSYNMVNNGNDEGTNWFGLWDLSDSMGNPTWSNMPYDDGDYSSWGDETAFRNAAMYRSTGYEWFNMEDYDYNTCLNYLKTSIENGYSLGFGIDADAYPESGGNMFNPPTWEGDEVVSSTEWGEEATLNHAQTVIGYDDNVQDSDGSGETGAFHIANSWGDWGPLSGTADGGTYWMTYECFIDNLLYQYVYRLINTGMYDDTNANSPELLGTWEFSNAGDRDPDVHMGISETDQGDYVEDERILIYDGSSATRHAYPNFMCADLTDYVATWDNMAGANFFALDIGESEGTASTMGSWTVEHWDGSYTYDDLGASTTKTSCESPEAGSSNPVRMWTTFTSTNGVARFDQEQYGLEDTIGVSVEDEDLIGAGSVSVDVTSPQETETVSLSVDPRYDHIWLGTIDCSATDAGGVLQVNGGDEITLDYNNGEATDTAAIDDTPPAIASGPTTLVKIGAASEFTTDELTNVTINYGLDSANLDMSASSGDWDTAHRVAMDRLDPRGQTYYYEVVMENEAGLTTVDDNGGSYYTFTSSDFDDVEAGNVGWTFGGPQSKEGRWAPRDLDTVSGSLSWNLGNTQYGNGWWDWMESPAISTDGMENAEWTWDHAYRIEPPDSGDYWDGFVVEVRYHDGTSWQPWDRATPDGGYDGTVYPDYEASPFVGEDVFGGYSNGDGSWNSERVDLSAWLPAQYIQVRYYFASDDYSTEYGVDIDDITLTSPDETLVPPEVTVDQPNGGETLAYNDDYTIQWTSTAGDYGINEVTLSYSVDGGATYTTIDTVPTSAGTDTYTWSVPNEDSIDCKVRARVFDTEGNAGSDESDGTFTITPADPPTIDLTQPDGGEEWWAGERHNITWTTTEGTGTITGVELLYSIDGGGQWETITADTADDGQFEWMVPNEPSTSCYVQAIVHDDVGSSASDTSANTFTIIELAPMVATVTSPNGGENFDAGTTETITWELDSGNYSTTSQTLSYSTDNGGSWTDIVTLDDAQLRSYDWTVPDHNSDQCLVRVSASGTHFGLNTYDNTNDVSDNVFTITGTPAAAPTNLDVQHTGTAEDDTTVETRYMRDDNVLGTTQSSTEQVNSVRLDGGAADAEWGIRVTVGGTELTGGSPEAIVTRGATGAGMQSATWNCPETTIADTDTVVIDVYAQIVGETGWELQASFESEALGSDRLDAATWTINYYTEYDSATTGQPSGRFAEGWFYWGASTADSRIDDFTHSIAGSGGGTDDNLVTWNASADEPAVTGYNIYRADTQSGLDTATLYDTVTADGSASYEYVDTGAGEADSTYWWYRVYSDEDGFEGASTSSVQEPGASSYDLFDISLTSGGDANGWNFVSFNLDANGDNYAQANDLVEILEDTEYGISGSYDKVMYYDAASDDWRSYVPGRADHYNDITTWDNTMGVWIQMNAGDTLTVEGTAPTSTEIQLEAGWNMVSYPSDTAMASDGLPAEVTNIGYFNAGADYNIAYTAPDAAFDLNPGEAYWLYCSAATTWTVTY